MPLSLYQASVPVYLKLLGGLGVMIDKAVSSAEAHKYPSGNVSRRACSRTCGASPNR